MNRKNVDAKCETCGAELEWVVDDISHWACTNCENKLLLNKNIEAKKEVVATKESQDGDSMRSFTVSEAHKEKKK